MIKSVLKYCLFDLKDGTSQRGSIIRLNLKYQLFSRIYYNSTPSIH